MQEILAVLKETHKYQLDQNDQFPSRSQLIFVVVGLYFNVAFIVVDSNNIVIFISRIILLLSLGASILFALPILRKTGYKTSPRIETFVPQFKKRKYNHDHVLAYLIENYQTSIRQNKEKNSKRNCDFMISMYLLGFSTLIIIVILLTHLLLSISK